MSASASETYDAVVVGAGPAGTATAAILAEAGHRVALLDKNTFPRYRVGESLIPHCWFPLDRLGLVEKLDQSDFIVGKNSVQFVSEEGERSKPYYFFEHRDHASSRTWQVVRSEFDQMLLDNAVEKGAELFTGTVAKNLLRENGVVVGVTAGEATLDSGGATREFRARVTVDASGRETFAQRENSWRVGDQVLKKLAVWTYFEGAQRDEGLDAGATTVAYVGGTGWFWYIPLVGDKVSVGVVADPDYLYREGRDPDEIFAREVRLQPWIEAHLRPGRKTSKCRVTSDFSYRSRYSSEDGLVLTGDAFAFLDPVFSSGVYLALQSGVTAGDSIAEALAANDVTAPRFQKYSDDLCHQIESMRNLVYMFYDPTFHFGPFFRVHPDLREAVTDCLIGNLSRDYGPLFEAARLFLELPEPLAHGRPLRA